MLVRWTQGDDHGLVWEHGLAVLSGDVDAEAARRLWTEFAAGGDLAAFLKALSAGTGADLLSLPDFAIALRASGGWQLAARGPMEAKAGNASVRGEGITTWAERFVSGAGPLSVGHLMSGGQERPIVAGLVPSAALAWDGSTEAPGFVSDPSEAVSSGGARAAGRAPWSVAPSPVAPVAVPAPEPVAPASAPSPTSAPSPAEESAQPVSASSPAEAAEQPAAIPAPLTAPAAPSAVITADLPPAEVEDHDEGPGDGATMVGDLDDLLDDESAEASEAGVAADGDDAAPFAPPLGHGRFARQFGETQVVSVEAAAVREPVEDVFISGVPKAEEAVPDEGDHDGHTMMASAADMAAAFADPTPADAGDGPMVLGVICANGHANPPQRPSCTVCGADLHAEPTRVPRPSLGRVLLPNGEHIELTRPVIIGRNPRADRVPGGAVPRLVPLSQGHVSGTHLELKLEDWNVLAVDLHSTNGTFLRRAGEAPVRLGERPELLIAGDVLDLGHGVQLVVEQLR